MKARAKALATFKVGQKIDVINTPMGKIGYKTGTITWIGPTKIRAKCDSIVVFDPKKNRDKEMPSRMAYFDPCGGIK